MTGLRAFAKRIHDEDGMAGWTSDRQKYLIWPVLAIALVTYVLLLPTFQVGTWTDDGFYINFARSLAQGQGMRLIHLPNAPVDAIVPPGYPLLLSPLAFLFPDSFLPMQILSVLFTLGTIYALYYFCRDRFSFIITALFIVLFAINPHVASGSIWVMSEAPFVFFMCLSLIFVEFFVTRQELSPWIFILTVIVTSAMILIRYVGLPLLIGAGGYILYRRRDRYAFLYILLVVVVVISITLLFGGAATWERYSNVGDRLLSHITRRSIEPVLVEVSPPKLGLWAGLKRDFIHLITYALPMSVVPLFSGPRVEQFFISLGLGFIPMLLSLLITLSVLIGYSLRLLHNLTLAEVFPVVYTGFLLIMTQGKWPDLGSSFRYIFPMIPFALLYFVQAIVSLAEIGSTWLRGKFKSLIKTGLPVAVGLVLMMLYLGRNAQAMLNPVRTRIPDISLGATWIAENTNEDALIMAEVPRVHTLYTRRTIIPFPDGKVEAQEVYGDQICTFEDFCLEDIIERYAVDYILISYAISSELPFHNSAYVESYVLPFLYNHPERFKSVYIAKDGMVEVFKVLND